MENFDINDVYYIHNFYKDKFIPNISPIPYKGSSTKSGNNPKDIAKRRKKNKNKKTHRR